jgi:hypothetical protein
MLGKDLVERSWQVDSCRQGFDLQTSDLLRFESDPGPNTGIDVLRPGAQGIFPGGSWGSACRYFDDDHAQVKYKGVVYDVVKNGTELTCTRAWNELQGLQALAIGTLGGAAISLLAGLLLQVNLVSTLIMAAASGAGTFGLAKLALRRQPIPSIKPGATWTAQAGG